MVLNPHTPIEAIKHVLQDVDLVLVMTVNPGFGGQSFIPSTVSKIEELKEIKHQTKWDFEIEVDGGVSDKTANLCVEAGAEVLVAGSAVFGKQDRPAAIKLIRSSMTE